jgi:hypothetical protein
VRAKETSSFPCPLGEKNFSHSSAYASLHRKTKRAREKVRHDNNKNKTKTHQQLSFYFLALPSNFAEALFGDRAAWKTCNVEIFEILHN